MNNTDTTHRKGIIGNPSSNNFWLYDSKDGFDLTHPPTPTTPLPSGTTTVKLQTTTLPITISAQKTALVIVDMQNFFLSQSLGRPCDSKGMLAQKQLLDHAIPAARKAGIQIIWLNWGLTETELINMPPGTLRALGFESVPAEHFAQWTELDASKRQGTIDSHGVNEGCHTFPAQTVETEVSKPTKDPRLYRGFGSDIGPVTLQDSTVVPAGRLLMRDTWNADLTPELRENYEQQGLASTTKVPDVWIHKNRMSGLWGSSTACTEFLDEKGIQTLLFAGVNTDQCVGGSLQDAFSKGYDAILLTDGCGTTSPASSQESIEFNSAKTWGFATSCRDFAEGVDASLAA